MNLQMVRRLPLYVDAARRLGPGWVAFRLRYAAELKSGVHVRRSPLGEWPVSAPTSWRPTPIVDADGLSAWLLENYCRDQRQELAGLVSDLRERRFGVFGTKVQMEDWHHDPFAGVRYPRETHWSQVSEFPDADLKRIWEPSRFGWAFDLVRAHVVVPECGAGELFWELFDEWREQNPPNEGVNWQCGQEASLRLMAVTCAAQAMPEILNDMRMGQLQQFAEVTANRVASNIAYARSQKNNHHISEAVGLLTASYLHPDGGGEQWHKLGQRHLKEVAETLIFQDGGSSQYSTNYHRVFVQNLTWAKMLSLRTGGTLLAEVSDALERSALFLSALVEPISGSGPFFGPDDGARVLPLDRVPHRDLAHDAHIASAVAGCECGCGLGGGAASTEGLAWLGMALPSPTKTDMSEPWVKSFADIGLHLLVHGSTRVYVRCGSYEFRPAHEDQLHCDIWIDGRNVASDSGTQSYKPASGEPGPLSGVAAHNSPHIEGEPQMPTVGRFLKARWPSGSIVRLVASEDSVSGVFTVHTDGSHHFERTVEVSAEGVRVDDSCQSDSEFVTHWSAPCGVTEVRGSKVKTYERTGFRSDAYGRFDEVPVLICQASQQISVFWANEREYRQQ